MSTINDRNFGVQEFVIVNIFDHMAPISFEHLLSLQFSGSGDALLSGMGQTILIWKQKPEESEVTAYQEKISNLKNLMVEEWPGYKPPSKPSAKSKKQKKLEDN